MKIVCTRQCFWRNKRWNPGDVATVQKGEEFPRHFDMDGDPTDKPRLKKTPKPGTRTSGPAKRARLAAEKPSAKSNATPKAASDSKPDSKSETKPDSKPDSRPDSKADSRPAPASKA